MKEILEQLKYLSEQELKQLKHKIHLQILENISVELEDE
jgi:hypothetical protein|tara:strand:+ start:851 stop:967 length:117 start_codon:yes stop_codon:yes gene_type:complete